MHDTSDWVENAAFITNQYLMHLFPSDTPEAITSALSSVVSALAIITTFSVKVAYWTLCKILWHALRSPFAVAQLVEIAYDAMNRVCQ